jgi:hypothetical protein
VHRAGSGYDRPVTVFWIALAVAIVLPLVGVVLVVVRGLAFYRTAKRTSGRFAEELARIERTSAEIDVNMRLATEASARLREATARLTASRAQLAVQLAALREARDSLGVLSLLLK